MGSRSHEIEDNSRLYNDSGQNQNLKPPKQARKARKLRMLF